MKHIVKFLAVVVLSISATLSSVPSARANSVTNFIFTYGTPLHPINTPWSDPIQLPLLNIVGGSLQSVTFHVSADFYATNQINNTSNQAADFTQFSTTYRVRLSGQAGGPLATTLGTINLYNQTQDNSDPFTLNSHTVSNWFVSASVSGTQSYSVGNGNNLSAFTNATHFLVFNAFSLASANDTTTVNGETAQLTYQAADMTLTVSYNYTGTAIVWPTPEPSAGILFGMGGLACCGWQFSARKRRNRKRLADSNEA